MSIIPLFILAAGLLGFVTLLSLAFSGPNEAKLGARRLASVRERHAGIGAISADAQLRRILARRDNQFDSFFNRFVPRPEMLRKRLTQTGKNWTLGKYVMVSGGMAMIIILALVVQGFPPLLALLLAAFAALGLPHLVTGYLIKRRLAKFNARFPDAIELLVRGLRSGLPISETLSVVAKEVPDPVGEEFRTVVDAMKIGRTMEEALDETATRLDTAEFKFFCITLAIQRETGGNLAETLSNLATVLRQRMQMKLKIKAMSSESKASAYIVGSLPFIVFGLILMINPSYMGEFFVDERLIIAGLGGMGWMGIGVFIMAKMVSFEI